MKQGVLHQPRHAIRWAVVVLSLCLPALCLLFPVAARADSLHVKHLGIVQGLAQSSGSAVAQGPNGLLWLGTQSGLQRYDGYSFIYYHHIPGDAASLSQDDVRAIVVGVDRSVWVATGHGGLNRLKPDHSGFQHFIHNPDDPNSLASEQLYALLLDHQGRLWVAGDEGVDRLLSHGGFRHYGVGDAHAKNRQSYALMQDSRGRLWAGTHAGLLYLDQTGDALRRFQPGKGSDPAAVKALGNSVVNCLIESRDGRLWIGTTDGLFVLSFDRHRHIEAWLHHDDADPGSLAGNRVRALVEDHNGAIWVGTFGNGLDRLDPTRRGWTFDHFRHDAAHPDGLSNNTVQTLFTDATGLVWIGTYGGGFDIYNPRSSAFGAIRHSKDDPHSLLDDIVWAIYRDDAGNTWVGTRSGLTRFGKHAHDVSRRVFGDSVPVYVLHGSHDGRLWVGTDAGLYRNDGTGTPFHKMSLAASGDGKDASHISQILGDRQGRLWVATATALLRLDPASGRVLQRFQSSHGVHGLPTSVTTMCQTSDGTLWLGTQHGLRRFDGVHPRFTTPPIKSGHVEALANSDILSCLATPDGNLWVGTADGLIRYQPTTGTERVYDIIDGLPSATIYALLRDASGKIWASTSRGLVRIDPANGQMRSYGQSDGLSNEEFNQLASFRHDGTLYFGGIHGVTMVYPARLKLDMPKARVGITGYILSGHDTKQVHLAPPNGPLTIKYWQNTLTFNLAVFDYSSPGNNSFRYRLEGFDTTWHSLHDHHSVTYTNLDPGQYTLLVKGVDSNGLPTANLASLDFHVQPPPWLSPWAWLLYVASGLLLVALGLRVFATWIHRRRDLASEQQRRRWAELLHELVHATSQLSDEYAIATELVQRLPGLIPHQYSAFYAGSIDAMELVTMRGFAEADLVQLQTWIKQHPGRMAELCRQGQPRSLDDIDPRMRSATRIRRYMALPLNAASGQYHILLIGRDDTVFSEVEMELANVLARQVRVVLDKAGLIRQLATLAHTDSLTGVSNRGWFVKQADIELQRCRRYAHPLSALLVDVDHFKQVNDTHGHAAGDTVLATMVKHCRKQLRTNDIIGRYGGEEFAICLPETSLESAMALAERLRQDIAATEVVTPVGSVRITVSIGVASLSPTSGDSLDILIARADKALYVAKEAGRNCVRASVHAASDPA
ncbi:MAG TPA: two-component regulator propeller domain-containing protein [Rhodanobacteraceae bacterium]|nr:two-component regulator propeller domain-containing protein [Rhodanobacteraceae bacterium]